jgi:tetratricopeptide (TPR) repeat protein
LRRSLPFVALALLAATVYANSLRGPFLFDDLASIPENPSIRQLSTAWFPPNRGEAVSGRPLVNVTYAIDYAVAGTDVTAYHVTNLAIHVACALLLFAIVRRTYDDAAVAFACAAIWMVHPLETEAVDYLSARTESAMALCLLLTLYAAIRGWTIAAVTACAAGMACKETMVVAPLLVVLYDVRRTYRSWRAAWHERRALWLGLASTWIVLAMLIASAPRAHSAGFQDGGVATYALNQAAMIARYIRLFIWPSALVLDYGFPRPLRVADVALALALIAALGLWLAFAWRRHGRIAFLLTWFFLTLAPASSFVPVLTEVGAERRMYVPSMALVVLAVTLAWSRVRAWPRIAALVCAAVVIALGAQTVARNREYASALTMWRVTVERWPQGRARLNYAAALQAAGQPDEMLTQLRLAVIDFPEARYDLGAQLVTHGDADEGLRDLEAFVREFPTHPNAGPARELIATTHITLARRATDQAIAQVNAGRLADALPLFRRAVELMPENANVHRNLANALLDARDYSGAAAEAREALRRNPTDSISKDILIEASRR